jgi:two-component system nitrogen regulation response regulator GlnG
MMKTLLIADDDISICKVLQQAFQREGYDVVTVHNGYGLMQLVLEGKGDVVITDVLMPDESGLDLLPRIKQLRPELPVIVISAQNTLITAVKATEAGAYDYLPKPFELDTLIDSVARCVEQQPVNILSYEQDFEKGSTPIIGRSQAMQDIYKTLARVISVDLSILITGESGTGKELLAHAMHALGNRRHLPFVARNVAAIPKDLVESELFGHEKGAFTGAVTRKAGAFELAGDGILFLDEIGDMPPEAQTRLLRVLQQGEYTPVGSTSTLETHARIISATHADLGKMVLAGSFRKDLFYRLNVVQVRVPPLRDRKDDIPALVSHFLSKAVSRGLPLREIERSALPQIMDYSWPGNVRELENFIYRLATLHADPVIRTETVEKELGFTNSSALPRADSPLLSDTVRQHVAAYFKSHGDDLPSSGLYDRLLPLFEKPLIEVTLEATGGNQFRSANILGINRNTLRKKIKDLGIRIQSTAD